MNFTRNLVCIIIGIVFGLCMAANSARSNSERTLKACLAFMVDERLEKGTCEAIIEMGKYESRAGSI